MVAPSIVCFYNKLHDLFRSCDTSGLFLEVKCQDYFVECVFLIDVNYIQKTDSGRPNHDGKFYHKTVINLMLFREMPYVMQVLVASAANNTCLYPKMENTGCLANIRAICGYG